MPTVNVKVQAALALPDGKTLAFLKIDPIGDYAPGAISREAIYAALAASEAPLLVTKRGAGWTASIDQVVPTPSPGLVLYEHDGAIAVLTRRETALAPIVTAEDLPRTPIFLTVICR